MMVVYSWLADVDSSLVLSLVQLQAGVGIFGLVGLTGLEPVPFWL